MLRTGFDTGYRPRQWGKGAGLFSGSRDIAYLKRYTRAVCPSTPPQRYEHSMFGLTDKVTQIIAGGILAVAVALGVWCTILTHERDAARAGWKAETAAHAQTIANYRLAAEQARADDLANARAVETRNAQIAEETEHAYQTKLADSDARYAKLRAQADAYSRNRTAAGMPQAGETACIAYAATSCEKLPPLLKAAQDNTDQLIALQAWAARVAP